MENIVLLKSEHINFNGNYFLQITSGRTLSSIIHKHDFFEVIIIMCGECVHVLNGKEQIFTTGNFSIISPDDVHYFKSQKPNTSIVAISIKICEMSNFISAFLLNSNDFNKIFYLLPDERQRLEKLSNSTLSCPQNIALYKCIVGIIITRFLESQVSTSKNIPDEFKNIIAEMNKLKNAADGITAFIQIAKYSRSQLWRLTKKYFGVTPAQYVNDIRMKYAYDMIAYGNLAFEDIADKVGFSSFSHFITLIKKNYGLTPAAIRKKIQK